MTDRTEGEPNPGRTRSRPLDRLAYAHDASHYLLVPQSVVVPANAEEVAGLLRRPSSEGTPLPFRCGGTSLSGQASRSGVLVETRAGFRRVEVLDGGKRVRTQPGATVRDVNVRLAPYGWGKMSRIFIVPNHGSR